MTVSKEDLSAKHWLDYFDVFAKVAFSIAAVIATLLGGIWTRAANHRSQELIERQTKNQIQAIELQDRASQAQAAWSVMPYLNCKSSLSTMALKVTHDAAPMYEVDAATALLPCAKTPAERTRAN